MVRLKRWFVVVWRKERLRTIFNCLASRFAIPIPYTINRKLARREGGREGGRRRRRKYLTIYFDRVCRSKSYVNRFTKEKYDYDLSIFISFFFFSYDRKIWLVSRLYSFINFFIERNNFNGYEFESSFSISIDNQYCYFSVRFDRADRNDVSKKLSRFPRCLIPVRDCSIAEIPLVSSMEMSHLDP